EYMVEIKYDGEEVSGSFTVKTDPRIDVNIDVLKANYKMSKTAQKLSEIITKAGQQIQETQKAIQTVREYSRNNRSPKTRDLMKAVKDLETKLKKLSEVLNPTPPKQGIADRSAGLSSQVRRAVFGLAGGLEPVSQAGKVRYEKIKLKAEVFLKEFNQFYKTDVEEFKKLVQESGFSLFKSFKPLK
ncbi:unnamed protein product, partial [marine sediment metagenome]